MSAFLETAKAIKYPGQVFTFRVEPEIEDMEVIGDSVSFTDVVAEGEYFGAGARVSVRGSVNAVVHGHCAKCLEPVAEDIESEIDAVFAREIDPEDPDLYYFVDATADITDAVRDALLLAMPYRFLCSEDCKGLCAKCGTNLNLGTCTCQEDADVANPFSALKAIVQNNEEV